MRTTTAPYVVDLRFHRWQSASIHWHITTTREYTSHKGHTATLLQSRGRQKKVSTLPLVISMVQVPYLPHAYIPTSGRSQTTREMQRARAIPKSCLTNIPLHIRSGVGVQPLHYGPVSVQPLHRGPVSLPTTPASPPRSTAIHHSRLSTAVQCPCTPLQPLHRGPVSLPSTPASPPRSSIPAHHYRATVLPRGCGLNRLLRPSLWPSRLRASSMA